MTRFLQALSLLTFMCIVFTGCGPMKVRTTKYFSLANEDHRNIYRLRVRAKSVLGKAEFRNGWFPEESVDMLFGSVADSVESEYQRTQKNIKLKLNASVEKTYKMWLDTASKINPSDTVLKQILAARKRVLAYPYGIPYPETYEIEYNPAISLALKHADEKEVFILSSNPDEVVGKIASFAESTETAKSVNQLASLVYAQQTKDIVVRKTAADSTDSQIRKQIEALLETLKTKNINDPEVAEGLVVLEYLLK